MYYLIAAAVIYTICKLSSLVRQRKEALSELEEMIYNSKKCDNEWTMRKTDENV